MAFKISLGDVISKLDLRTLVASDRPMPDIYLSDLNRPGIELAGYFNYFAYDRIQILGMSEIAFLQEFSPVVRKKRVEEFLSYDVPCVIITRSLEPPKEILDMATKHRRMVLGVPAPTTLFMSRLTNFLESELAPRTTLHGGLVDIYGVGVLIKGESGIGKSETAIELIKRGHRLVADDAVDVKQVAENVLVGTAPEILKYYIEVRGLGIIDVRTVFGAAAVRNDIKIEMVVELVEWDAHQETDRLGLDEEKIQILGSLVTKKTIPIRPGRNVAAILEVAAMDFRLKSMGINAALEFSQRLFDSINNN